MSFLAPLAFALGAFSIPLVVLYMLRTRRRQVEVSSTLLWREAGQPVSSAVPWQPLRVTPLLILQLLTLAAFVFALARPFFTQETLLGPHTVFVLDTSGSMAMAGRLDRAMAEANRLATDVSVANLVSVVEAGPSPRVVTAFAQDAVAVAAAIDSLRPTGGLEDLDTAIRLARGLATPDRPTSVLLFSDGGAVELSEEPVVGARQLLYDDLGDNLAVTAFSLETSAEGSLRAFVEVANYTGENRNVKLATRVNDLAAGFVDVETEPGATARRTFPLDAGPGDFVTVSLVEGGDALPLDDFSSLVVGSGPERRVAILGEGSPFLTALVDIVPGFVAAETAGGTGGGIADIAIIDGGRSTVVDRPSWILRTDQPPEGITVREFAQNLAVTYQRPGEPILDNVDLSTVAVAEAQVVDAPRWLSLIRAGQVPLVLLGEVNGHRVVYFTFDATHSNLPVQVAFPIMGARILDWLAGAGSLAVSVEPAGAPIALAPPAGYTATVLTPSGGEVEVGPEAAVYGKTGDPGIYRVEYRNEQGAVEPGPIAVRHFVASESSGPYRVIPTVAPPGQEADRSVLIREWAPWALGAILVLASIEWWWGHQRPTGRRPDQINKVAA